MKNKFLLLMTLFSMQVMSALAGATLSMNDFSVISGKTYTVEVTMNNDVSIGGVSGKLTLPNGVTLVDNSMTKGTIVPSAYNLSYNADTHQFTLNNMTTLDKIPAGTGVLFSFDVEVGNLAEAADITISDIYTSAKLEGQTVYTNVATATTITATLTPVACAVEATPTSLEMMLSDVETVTLSLVSSTVQSAAMLNIALPVGLELVEGSVQGGELMNGHAVTPQLQSNSSYNVMIMSGSNANFTKESGTLLTFQVQPTGAIAECAQILVSNIVLTTAGGVASETDDVTINVTVSEEEYALSADNVEIEGEDGTATVTLNLDCPGAQTAAEMYVKLPENLKYMDGSVANGTLLADHVASMSYVQAKDAYKVLIISQTNSNFTAQSGSLITFQVQAEGVIPENSTIDVTDVVFSNVSGKTVDVDDLAIPVAQTIESVLEFDAESGADLTSMIAELAGQTVAQLTVKRSLPAGKFVTIVLPFDVKAKALQTALGQTPELYDFTGAEDVEEDGNVIGIDVTLTKKSGTANKLTANKPMVIKVATAVNEFTLENVEFKNVSYENEAFADYLEYMVDKVQPANLANVVYDGDEVSTANVLVGTYSPLTGIGANNDYYIKDNMFYHANNATSKPTRAYFMFESCTYSPSAKVRMIIYDEESQSTSIQTVQGNVDNDVIYNLNGQRVESMHKGLYIMNGKKYIIR